MTPDLFWIPGPWRGRLAIATRPRGGDWLEDEAAALRRAGIDTVVSLLESDEAEQLGLSREQAAATKNGIHFRSFPIPDRGVPSSTQKALSLMADIANALDDGKNVAVHCRQGIGRSGLIAAGVLMTTGMNPTRAAQTVTSARGLAVPETPAQRQWLESLASALPVSKSG